MDGGSCSSEIEKESMSICVRVVDVVRTALVRRNTDSTFWSTVNLHGRRCGHAYISHLYYKQKKTEIKSEDTMRTENVKRLC